MATTYLQLVNDVLTRLREPTVSSVTESNYSSLIGKLVIDAKREVEDAYNWECLKTTFTISTTSGTYSYVLTNAGTRFKIIQGINDTQNWFLEPRSNKWFTENLNLSTNPETGSAQYYNFNGVNVNGDSQVDLFPIPNSTETIRFDIIKPEAELSANTDSTLLPKSPIVLLAWAKAIEERGEDGGVNVNSQYAVAKQSLADHIAIEASRRDDEFTWYWS